MKKLDNAYLREVMPGTTLWLYPTCGPAKEQFDPAHAREKIGYTVIKITAQKFILGISIDGQPPFSLVITRTLAQLTSGYWWRP